MQGDFWKILFKLGKEWFRSVFAHFPDMEWWALFAIIMVLLFLGTGILGS
jgi:hypothetical protein